MNPLEVVNSTPFAAMPLVLISEEGRETLVVVIKGTFVLMEDGRRLGVAEKQQAVNVKGEYYGDPDTSSMKHEPEVALMKPATDVILLGHAWAPRAAATEVDVSMRVGPIRKTVKVFGDRCWVAALGTRTMTRPQPFEKIPLVYERSFGGWDRSHPEPARHTFEPRNPVGRGFRDKRGKFEEGVRLPNLENPQHPIRNYSDSPPPAGFGFVSPAWQPRTQLAGTFDDAWKTTRCPLLPKDFNPRFYNAAPDDQIVQGYLRGDEPAEIVNTTPAGTLKFALPGLAAPTCTVHLKARGQRKFETRLDTVVVDSDANLVTLIWRGALELREPVHEVGTIGVGG